MKIVGWAKGALLGLSAWASRNSGEGKSHTRRPSPLWRLALASRTSQAILPTLRISDEVIE